MLSVKFVAYEICEPKPMVVGLFEMNTNKISQICYKCVHFIPMYWFTLQSKVLYLFWYYQKFNLFKSVARQTLTNFIEVGQCLSGNWFYLFLLTLFQET